LPKSPFQDAVQHIDWIVAAFAPDFLVMIVVVGMFLADSVAIEVLNRSMVPVPIAPLTAMWKRTPVSMVWVEMLIYMSVEMVRSVEPRARSKKNSSPEPFRTIVAIRSALIWRVVEVPIRARRLRPNLNAEADLCLRFLRGCQKQHSGNCDECKIRESLHNSSSLLASGPKSLLRPVVKLVPNTPTFTSREFNKKNHRSFPRMRKLPKETSPSRSTQVCDDRQFGKDVSGYRGENARILFTASDSV
jgi:hypothetical protein